MSLESLNRGGSNLASRIEIALCLLVAFAVVVMFDLFFVKPQTGGVDIYIPLVILGCSFLLTYEVAVLIKSEKFNQNASNHGLWSLYFAVCASMGILLVIMYFDNPLDVLVLFIAIVCTDIGAYVGGKTLKGIVPDKPFPKISPNKTYIGIFCGAFLAGIALWLVDAFFMEITSLRPFVLGASLGVISQISDALASCLKRLAEVKDSGTVLGAHGGFLDRFDGWVLTFPFYMWLLILTG